MIRVESLTKSYLTLRGRKTVFRDLDFEVPENRSVGLIGRNGAGKSTMMRLLAGVDLPDKGRIVTPQRLSWPVGLSGGMVPSASARENVRFVCRLYGVRGEAMKRVEEFVAGFAEIGDWFDLPLSSYSSGMRARVAFGTSMAFQFDYYLIDEVMGVGDARFKAKSRVLFAERMKSSKIILVSHSMKLIKSMCEVVVHLDSGRATVYEDVDAGIAAYERIGGKD
ncbi:ABC transporter ATP-binding protein [Ideonella sp. DXS29W]|uniref:ABC transporter ATP-binding protein n=1 Tax=Ideonella lacteola TaxID=2984193 RepID=A0ABU9BPG4_9BURK